MRHKDKFKVGYSEDYAKNYDKIDWKNKQNDEWIYVKDKLPKAGINVEAISTDGDRCYVYLCKNCKDEWRDPITGGLILIDVLKWKYCK